MNIEFSKKIMNIFLEFQNYKSIFFAIWNSKIFSENSKFKRLIEFWYFSNIIINILQKEIYFIISKRLIDINEN